MNIDKIVDSLDVEALRNIIKDECHENYNSRIINALRLLDEDKSLIKNKELYDTYRYIDDTIDDLDCCYSDLDSFDDDCNNLLYVLRELDKDIDKELFEGPILIVVHMLDRLKGSLKYIPDGLDIVVDELLELIELLYSKAHDSRLIIALIATMGKDRFKNIKADYLLKLLDSSNYKLMLECLKKEGQAINPIVLEEIFKYEDNIDLRLSLYKKCMNVDYYIKSLRLLYDASRIKEFDSLYFNNKDIYEVEIRNAKTHLEYYTLLYNRFNGNDNKRALDSLRRIIRVGFNKDIFEKSLLLSSEEDEIAYYKETNIKALCDVYLYLKRYDTFRLILLRNKTDKLYDRYLDDYGSVFKNEYYSYYKGLILDKLSYAKDRNAYHEIALIAMKLLKLDLDSNILKNLASYIKNNYGSKRLLMNELNEFFSCCEV